MVKHCSHGLCKNDSRKPNARTMTNRYGEGVFFVRFPGKKRNTERAKAWIPHACRRDKDQLNLSKLSYHHFICSLHFVGENGPTSENPDPVAATMSVEQRNRLEKAYQRATGKRPLFESQQEQQEEYVDVKTKTERIDNNIYEHSADLFSSEENQDVVEALLALSDSLRPDSEDCKVTSNHGDCDRQHAEPQTVEAEKEQSQPASIITDDGDLESEIDSKNTDEIFCNTDDTKALIRELFIANILRDPMYYTGVKSVELLKYIFSLIHKKASRMNLWPGNEKSRRKGRGRNLSLWEEFLLVLVRNRRGTDVKMIADLFGTYLSNASNVYITWNLLLDKELEFLRRLPTAKQVEKHLLKSMKTKNGKPKEIIKDVRVIIDAVEFRCETPSLPAAQKQLYSAYYNDNTYKLLIGCTPNGYISYSSALWSGSISDKDIVKNSGFLECLSPGDVVMADRGFGIRGDLALKGCKLHIPPKLKGKTLKPRASTKARRVSNARIHIERTIRRLKTYRILTRIQKLTQKSYMESVVRVCISLANLGNSLILE